MVITCMLFLSSICERQAADSQQGWKWCASLACFAPSSSSCTIRILASIFPVFCRVWYFRYGHRCIPLARQSFLKQVVPSSKALAASDNGRWNKSSKSGLFTVSWSSLPPARRRWIEGDSLSHDTFQQNLQVQSSADKSYQNVCPLTPPHPRSSKSFD